MKTQPTQKPDPAPKQEPYREPYPGYMAEAYAGGYGDLTADFMDKPGGGYSPGDVIETPDGPLDLSTLDD